MSCPFHNTPQLIFKRLSLHCIQMFGTALAATEFLLQITDEKGKLMVKPTRKYGILWNFLQIIQIS